MSLITDEMKQELVAAIQAEKDNCHGKKKELLARLQLTDSELKLWIDVKSTIFVLPYEANIIGMQTTRNINIHLYTAEQVADELISELQS